MYYASVNDVNIWHLMEGPVVRYSVKVIHSESSAIIANLETALNTYQIVTNDEWVLFEWLNEIQQTIKANNRYSLEIDLCLEFWSSLTPATYILLYNYFARSGRIFKLSFYFDNWNRTAIDNLQYLESILQQNPDVICAFTIPFSSSDSNRRLLTNLKGLSIKFLEVYSDSWVVEPNGEVRVCDYTAQHYQGIAELLNNNPNLHVTYLPMIDWDPAMRKLLGGSTLFRVHVYCDGFMDGHRDIAEIASRAHAWLGGIFPQNVRCEGLIRFSGLHKSAINIIQARINSTLDNYQFAMAFMFYQFMCLQRYTNHDLASKICIRNNREYLSQLVRLWRDDQYFSNTQFRVRDKIAFLKNRPVIRDNELFNEMAAAHTLYSWKTHIYRQLCGYGIKDKTKHKTDEQQAPRLKISTD